MPNKLDLQYRYLNGDKRSDILVFDPDSFADIELDVSLAHPLCLGSVNLRQHPEKD